MKKLLLPVSIIISLFILGFSIPAPLPIGSTLPAQDLKMQTTTGKMVSLKEAASSNGLLVIFSCNTCPYVIKNQERTNSAIEVANDLGLGSIIINSNAGQRDNEDSYQAMKDYAMEQQYATLYALDEKNTIADAFGATRTPECFLFDGELNLVYHGAIDDNPTDASNVQRRHLLEAMTEMTTGKKIAVQETKSVGCGIKRMKAE